MAKARTHELPACYATTMPGLEDVAGEEIEERLGGEVKKTGPGFVVFRVPEIDASLLRLRTTEDVFLLAWGSDQLTYRAEDLDRIQRWTAQDADWNRLLQLHHAVRPKPKGKPTYHLVAQMTGEHGYRRADAGKAFARGLAGKFPASWKPVEEDAAVEFWLTIHGQRAVCGLRLSDKTMRHRTYKLEHLPASLRPTLAAAMVRLADAQPGQIVLDPMCGAGTILAEQLEAGRGKVRTWGGDLDRAALRAAGVNLRRLGQAQLARWDATRLPLADASVERIVSNPPFGKQLSSPEEIGPLYRQMLREYQRVLKPNGRAVLLVGEPAVLRDAAHQVGWQKHRELRVRVLGQPAAVTVWTRPGGSS
ncbi:MAG: methyltransferase domain-containing protein [Planctomycetia bacterium]|nr:methyltransferase domain-containing protein [Planctomycetia bacterium]